MKTIIENICLSVETKKNSLSGGEELLGSIRISEDQTVARFREENVFQCFGPRKRIPLYRRRECSVTLNTETQKYRISVYIDPKEIHWPALADEAFYRCMNWLAERTNA